jgi:hypothetical protein
MIKKVLALPNWTVAASKGTRLAKTTPKNGIKFTNPLAIPSANDAAEQPVARGVVRIMAVHEEGYGKG